MYVASSIDLFNEINKSAHARDLKRSFQASINLQSIV